QLTRTGALVGSPAFMSPEQAEGRELTTASDVFAVGAMLVLAATGRNPFVGASTPQTLYNVVHSHAEVTGVPAALRPVVEACLAKRPEYRPTPAQLLEAVGSVSARSGWPAPVQRQIESVRQEAERWTHHDGGPRAPGPRRRGARRFAAAAALTVLAGGTAVAVVLTKGGSPEPDPVAGRTLTLSDDQLRRIDTCRLLGPDVVGKLGQPLKSELVDSSVCTTKIATADGRQPVLTIGVGTAAATAKPTPDNLAGHPVLDT
ncbi:protein kinase domain-containing protein, partial [Nocardia gipuzkoensis]